MLDKVVLDEDVKSVVASKVEEPAVFTAVVPETTSVVDTSTVV